MTGFVTLGGLESLIETARGPTGLALIFVYSVLVAVVLPLPGELVLLPAAEMQLGVPPTVSIAVVILVSAAGKAVGSVAALRIGRGAISAAPAQWLLARVVPERDPERPPSRVAAFANRHGYVGMALVLSVPALPDTATVYAFSVLDTDEWLFALAAFVGTVVRLLVTLALAAGLLVVV